MKAVKTEESAAVRRRALSRYRSLAQAGISNRAKGLFPAIGSGYRRETGQVLEIIPQTDPFAVRPGGTLPVQVLFRGKPLADVGVEIGDGKTKMKEEDIPRYKTNPGGNG